MLHFIVNIKEGYITYIFKSYVEYSYMIQVSNIIKESLVTAEQNCSAL